MTYGLNFGSDYGSVQSQDFPVSQGFTPLTRAATTTQMGNVQAPGITTPTEVGMDAPKMQTKNPITGQLDQPGFFQQGGGASLILGGIQTLGSLWNSFQQNKLAKESFQFQKEAFATNLENQEQSYNTELQDRINTRYTTEGRANVADDVASYVAANRL